VPEETFFFPRVGDNVSSPPSQRIIPLESRSVPSFLAYEVRPPFFFFLLGRDERSLHSLLMDAIPFFRCGEVQERPFLCEHGFSYFSPRITSRE